MHLRDIVGLFPDHHNKARTAVKQVIIFFAGAVSCLQFVETHLWSPIKQSAIKWSMPIHGKLKLLLCCCTHLCLLLQKCKFSYNLMSFNRTLFLQDNFISRFSIIFVVFIKTQGKLAVIIRFCCFTVISTQFTMQRKCLRLVVRWGAGTVSPTSKPVTPLVKQEE